MDSITEIYQKTFFHHTLAESATFGPGMVKNSIRSTRVKFASPHLVFGTFAFGLGGNLHDIWTVQFFPSLDLQYTISHA